MNLKLDANSFTKLTKQNRLSLDIHAETIIMCNLVDMHSRNDAGEKKKRAPQNAIHR